MSGGKKKKPDGIAILGSHPATVMQAPFEDNWLIYACSPHNIEHRTLPRCDERFELHIPIADQTRAYPYLRALEELCKKGESVWMRDTDAISLFSGAKLYPEELKDRFCPFMFTSSIAYMMAKAIDDAEQIGINQIGLWGIMQASPTEYTYQRPGIQYFIWEAQNRGIDVLAPDVSKLFEMPQEQW